MTSSTPKYQEISEGTTNILVYSKDRHYKGPAKRDDLPFYNPSMILNRDTSILIAQHLLNTNSQKLLFLDGLAASGIRGVRFCHELTGDFFVTINDISPTAHALIQRNISNNAIHNAQATNKNIHELLGTQHYHAIDIDPFGSPIRYLDGAIRALKHKGILSVTATDTAALCGVYPKVCRRRYFSQPFHSPMMHQVGLRILIAAIAREAAKYEKGVKPLLCYYTDHYFRCYLQLQNTKEQSTKTLSNINTVDLDQYAFKPIGKPQMRGPLWTGPLHHKPTLESLYKLSSEFTLNSSSQLQRLFPLWLEETQSPPFHYSTDILARNHHCDPPRIDRFKQFFTDEGYHLYKTHFGGGTFSTDAPYQIVTMLLQKYHRKRQKPADE